jgi:hypothetical protein
MRTAHGLPLSQLESMTLSYIPLFAATYFFWWIKPKDIKTPSIVELPNMLPEQRIVFESMAISNKFDDEGLEEQVSLWNVWYLTPRVFEKEAEDRAAKISKVIPANQNRVVTRREERSEQKIDDEIDVEEATSQDPATPQILTAAKETVLSHWDPELYHSKLWPVICLFGVSFGALHLISWNTMFPTIVELWLWRIAALVSIFSMLIFMYFEKFVFRWGGLLTIVSMLSPVFSSLAASS